MPRSRGRAYAVARCPRWLTVAGAALSTAAAAPACQSLAPASQHPNARSQAVDRIDSVAGALRVAAARSEPNVTFDGITYTTIRHDRYVRLRAAWADGPTEFEWDHLYRDGTPLRSVRRVIRRAAAGLPEEVQRTSAYFADGRVLAWRDAPLALTFPDGRAAPDAVARLARVAGAMYGLAGAVGRPITRPDSVRPRKLAPPGALTNRERLAFRAAVRRSSVLVEAAYADGRAARGSGVVVWRDGATALVLSSAHVVRDARAGLASSLRVTGVATPAPLATTPVYVVKNHEAGVDAALLVAYDPLHRLGPALPRAQGVGVGDRVLAVGHPIGDEPVVDEGTVASVVNRGGGQEIVHDALTEHGSSGGGLFTVRGELVGLNTFLDPDTQEGVALATEPFLAALRLRCVSVEADGAWHDTGVALGSGSITTLVAAVETSPTSGRATGPQRVGARGDAAAAVVAEPGGISVRTIGVDLAVPGRPTAIVGARVAAVAARQGSVPLRLRVLPAVSWGVPDTHRFLVVQLLER
jgi:S1-C subfamily serine protease